MTIPTYMVPYIPYACCIFIHTNGESSRQKRCFRYIDKYCFSFHIALFPGTLTIYGYLSCGQKDKHRKWIPTKQLEIIQVQKQKIPRFLQNKLGPGGPLLWTLLLSCFFFIHLHKLAFVYIVSRLDIIQTHSNQKTSVWRATYWSNKPYF